MFNTALSSAYPIAGQGIEELAVHKNREFGPLLRWILEGGSPPGRMLPPDHSDEDSANGFDKDTEDDSDNDCYDDNAIDL